MKNHFFKKAQQKASSLQNNNERIRTLLKSLTEKLSRVSWKNVRTQNVKEKYQILFRIVKAYIEGQYRNIPWKVIVSLLAAIIYFINPFDLIPDVVPIIGLTDDVSVMLWVFNSMQTEINNFLTWEKSQLSAL